MERVTNITLVGTWQPSVNHIYSSPNFRNMTSMRYKEIYKCVIENFTGSIKKLFHRTLNSDCFTLDIGQHKEIFFFNKST